MTSAVDYQHELAVRMAAVEALVTIGGPQAIDALIDAFRDPDESVRTAAAKGIGSIGDKKTMQRLSSLAKQDSDDNVRRTALMASLFVVGQKQRSASQQKNMSPTTANRIVDIGLFLLGAAAWGLAGVVTLIIPQQDASGAASSNWAIWVGIVVVLGLMFIAAFGGWDWYPQRPFPYWRQLKVMVLVFLMLTVVGLMPVCYWTGKGLLRLYYQLTQ